MIRSGRTLPGLLALAFAAVVSGGAPEADGEPPAIEPTLLHGRVETPGGEPLAGALVELIPFVDRYEAAALELAGHPSPEPAATAVTGDDGAFLLVAPEPGLWLIAASAPGRLGLFLPHLTLVPESMLAPVRLPPAVALTVRVADPEGTPVAGARVVVTPAGQGSPRSELEPSWRPRLRLATTGEKGTVRLPAVAGEEVAIQAVTSGEVAGSGTSATVPAGGQTVEIRVAPAPHRLLLVRDPAGRPAAGIVVAAGSPARPLGATGADGKLAGGLADAGGEIELTLLTPEDQVQQVRTGPPAGEPPAFVVRLAEPTWTSGRVIEADGGDPIAEALVLSLSNPIAFTRSEGDGYFRLPRRPARLDTAIGNIELPLMALAAGYLPAFAPPTTGTANAAGIEPSISLARAAALSGAVVDEDGRPVEEFQLKVAPGSMRAMTVAAGQISDPLVLPGGRFRASLLVPGEPYRLTAVAPGYPPATLEVQAPPTGEAQAPVRIVLVRGERASGRVLDGGGTPVAGAVVELSHPPAGFFDHGTGPTGNPTATAAEDGRFTFDAVAAGRFDLTARAPGFAPTRIRGVEIGAERGETDLGTVILEPGATLEGQVVDARGAPVAGIAVSAFDASRRMLEGLVGTTTTDPAGRFQFDDLAPGTVRVTANRPTGVSASLDRVPVPSPEPIRLVLPGGDRFAGRVVDEAGRSIGGARLVDDRFSIGSEAIGDFMTPAWMTDDEGRFAFETSVQGILTVKVSAEGFASRTIGDLAALAAEGGGEAVIVLGRAETLAGRVLDPDGRPVSDAVLVALEGLTELSPAELDRVEMPGAPRARTDGEGRYAFTDLGRGEYVLRASHPKYLSTSRRIEVLAGSNLVDVVLEPGLRLAGRVVTETGEPLLGAFVLLRPARQGELRETTTGSEGNFEFAGLGAGSYLVTARKEGFAEGGPREVDLGDPPASVVEIRLGPGGSIAGRVLGLDADELARVVVSATNRLGRWNRGEVDSNGDYRIAHVAPGEWQVRAALGQLGPEVSGSVTVVAPGAEVQLDLDFTAATPPPPVQ